MSNLFSFDDGLDSSEVSEQDFHLEDGFEEIDFMELKGILETGGSFCMDSDSAASPSQHDHDHDHDHDSLNSSSSEEEVLVPVKAKPRRKREHYYRGPNGFPQITRNDIRREFPMMWLNVINMNDAKMLKSLFNFATTKGCAHKNEFKGATKDLFPLLADTSSKEKAVLQCAYKSVTTPDAICQMLNCSIRRSKEFKGTQIMVTVRFSGTMLYDLVLPPECIRDDTAIAMLPSIDAKALNKYRVPAANPATVVVEGTFVITMEPNHFISQIMFLNSDVVLTPIRAPS